MTVGKIAVLLAVLVLFGTCAYAADCNSGARYADNNNGTVTDCKTRLIWLKNAKCTATSNGIANPNGNLSWDDAQKWAAGLRNGICRLNDRSYAGDWRLPAKACAACWWSAAAAAGTLGTRKRLYRTAVGCARLRH